MTALADSAFVIKRRGNFGELSMRIVDVTLNNNYDAGGWAVTAKQLGFGLSGEIDALIGGDMILDGYYLGYDRTNKKLMVRQGDNDNISDSPGIELAGASSVMNAKVARLVFVGRGHG